MKFVSTRNSEKQVTFEESILNCLPSDGGLYVPAYAENLSPWISYLDETTNFTSIAGSLTSALIKEEFSPIISEAIAAKAFPFSPELVKLNDGLYALELFHGPSGTHKDFGIGYLASCLEHVLLIQNKTAIMISATDGETGSAVAAAIRGKKNLKAIVLYEKGTMRGFTDEDCIWNGGNLYPVEVNGDKNQCYELIREIYSKQELVEKYALTLANTANIGRLLPHTFFYMYTFSRLKNHVFDNIYYGVPASNYSNIVAGLYAWKFSLPLNAMITNCTTCLTQDSVGKCSILDSLVPLAQRGSADPIEPSNIERLEEIFTTNPAVLKAFVLPSPVSDEEAIEACQELYIKYGKYYDLETSRSYASAKKQKIYNRDDGSTLVIIANKHPALPSSSLKISCGEAPAMNEKLKAIYEPIQPKKKISANLDELISILDEIKNA